MPWLILIVILLLIAIGPGIWVKRVMRRYHNPPDRYPGTGGQLAEHLLAVLGLEHVQVEMTDRGDHYDPAAKVVRLSPDNYDGKSLTAVTVAAHEVGHAIQDYDDYLPLKLRTELAKASTLLGRLGSAMVWLAPLVVAISRVPHAGLASIAIGLLAVLASSLVHFATLPVEWDASFGRAMPLLRKGGYLKEEDLPRAEQILRAAALTYLSASLFSIFQVWRWLRLPR